jgi:radical SAM protein with 4Fe4S-binding SPASM domain
MESRHPSAPAPKSVAGPRFITLELTDRCNLRCRMCWFWGEKGRGDIYRGRELPDETYERIIGDLAQWKPWVFLSGGEPLLRPATVLRIARTAARYGVPLSIINNGTVASEETYRSLVSERLSSITFSVDGPPLAHDLIRGKGAFERTKRSIQSLRRCRGSESLPIIGINFTITPWNHPTAREMVPIAEELGVDRLTFQHLWFTSPGQANAERALLQRELDIELNTIEGHVISHDFGDLKGLVESLKEIQEVARHSRVQVLTYPNLSISEALRYYSVDSYSPRSRCLSPWFSAVVKPNGDVVFCPDMWITEFPIGNVRHQGFGDVWTSQRAQKFRSVLWREKMFPACNRCCSLYGY